jgi:hypothetical protein
VRKPEHRARRSAVRIEANDGAPSVPGRVGTKNIDRDVARDRNDIAAIADEKAATCVERNAPGTAAQDGPHPLAPQQRCGLQRDRFQSRAAGPGHHGDCERRHQSDDQHHRHELDERETRAPSALSDEMESEIALVLFERSHFLAENRRPPFRKMR